MHGVVDRVPADQSRKELPSRAIILLIDAIGLLPPGEIRLDKKSSPAN